jgi:hypothetical protein
MPHTMTLIGLLWFTTDYFAVEPGGSGSPSSLGTTKNTTITKAAVSWLRTALCPWWPLWFGVLCYTVPEKGQ